MDMTDRTLGSKARIRSFLGSYFRDYELRDDEDIFSAGFVNSLFAMQLVLFVEREFGIEVSSEDLDIENFRSVNAMAALVSRRGEGEHGDST